MQVRGPPTTALDSRRSQPSLTSQQGQPSPGHVPLGPGQSARGLQVQPRCGSLLAYQEVSTVYGHRFRSPVPRPCPASHSRNHPPSEEPQGQKKQINQLVVHPVRCAPPPSCSVTWTGAWSHLSHMQPTCLQLLHSLECPPLHPRAGEMRPGVGRPGLSQAPEPPERPGPQG